MNESMNRLQTFIINFKQKCLEHGVEYKPRDKKEFDNFYKMGFVLSNYKLGYYDVHLLIDYEDNLKAIHLLGIEPHISMIAKEIQSTNVFCGIPVIVSALNNQYSPASITMTVSYTHLTLPTILRV